MFKSAWFLSFPGALETSLRNVVNELHVKQNNRSISRIPMPAQSCKKQWFNCRAISTSTKPSVFQWNIIASFCQRLPCNSIITRRIMQQQMQAIHYLPTYLYTCRSSITRRQFANFWRNKTLNRENKMLLQHKQTISQQ